MKGIKAILGTLSLAVVAVSSGTSVAKTWDVQCEFFHRPSVTVAPATGPVKTCTMSDDGSETAPLPMEFKVGKAKSEFSVAMGCGGALSVRVSNGSTQISSGLWQTAENLDNNHGITGLQYVYLPNGAELQFFCKEK